MSNSTPDILLEARGLHKQYRVGRQTLQVLRGLDACFVRGSNTAVRGMSGAGKSTLLHVLGCLDRPEQGEVMCEGRSIYRLPASEQSALRGRIFGFIFQQYHLLSELTVRENVLMPSMQFARGAAEADRRADRLLERVGLAERARHRPNELSGGEQQRVAIARALMNDPAILLADEPTGNLDEHTGEKVLDLIFDLAGERGRTLVLVTHDAAVADRCDRVLELHEGNIRND